MLRPLSSLWFCLAVIWMVPDLMPAQAPAPAKPAPPRIEPGLEIAVKWKWWVAPSDDKEWGVPLPEPEAPKPDPSKPGMPTITTVHLPEERPTVYEVKKGDALIIIAKKFGMKVAQLKTFNGMADDKIKVGQELRIPSFEELKTLQPPPPPPPDPAKKAEEVAKADEKKNKKKKKADVPETTPEASRELDNLVVQIFLDREQFSVGPIDGKAGATLLKVAGLYETNHPEANSTDALRNKAKEVVKDPYTTYRLRKEDFRFIDFGPPKASAVDGKEKKGPKSKSKTKDTPPPPRTYEEMVNAPFLGYQTPWAFIAERFHCDETYLHHLNRLIKSTPVVGTEFKVPNVIPFEIEKSLDAPLQPAANPDKPVTAAIVEMSRLEITQNSTLIAVMPLASAHPDLHGRGSWVVLDAIPQPRMATKQEVMEQPKPKVSSNLLGSPGEDNTIPTAKAVAPPPLDHTQYLPPGPGNPVGILWINLAKAKSTDPLPYGLHGTSIPEHMSTQRGIGGLRLANWNIARVVHLLPPGATIQWKLH